MRTFGTFVTERRGSPWPGSYPEEFRVAGAALYEAYRAYVGEGDPDYRVLPPRDFGVALGDVLDPDGRRVFTRARDADGVYWENITLETREARARRAVIPDVIADGLAAARAEHRERRHPDGGWCHRVSTDVGWCDMPVEVIERVVSESPGAEAAIAAEVELRFGAFLRWQPGDENPNIALREERRLDRLTALRADLVTAQAAHDQLDAEHREAWAAYSEVIRRDGPRGIWPPRTEGRDRAAARVHDLKRQIAKVEDEPRRQAAIAEAVDRFLGRTTVPDQGEGW